MEIVLTLEIPYGTCYNKIKEEQLPTSGCPYKQWLEKSTLVTWSKFWGGFSMLRSLSDKRKYECHQCKNEHTKGHWFAKTNLAWYNKNRKNNHRTEFISEGKNMIVGKIDSEKIRKEQKEKSYESINYAMQIIRESKIAPYVQKLLLYGSCVRNEQTYDSDVDLFLELSRNFPDTLRRDAIMLKSDVMPEKKELPDIDLKMVIGQEWKESKSEYYTNVKKEGINIWEN